MNSTEASESHATGENYRVRATLGARFQQRNPLHRQLHNVFTDSVHMHYIFLRVERLAWQKLKL